jgi:hypothetical protein
VERRPFQARSQKKMPDLTNFPLKNHFPGIKKINLIKKGHIKEKV